MLHGNISAKFLKRANIIQQKAIKVETNKLGFLWLYECAAPYLHSVHTNLD